MSEANLTYETIFNLRKFQIGNESTSEFLGVYQQDFCAEFVVKCSVLSVILGLLIICAVIGNSFVIAAVVLERNLHCVGNYLIVSLAIADLTVSVMVRHLCDALKHKVYLFFEGYREKFGYICISLTPFS